MLRLLPLRGILAASTICSVDKVLKPEGSLQDQQVHRY